MNEKLIEEFCNNALAKNISKNRVRKYRTTLRTLNRHLKRDFRECTKKDLVNYFAKLENDEFKPVNHNSAKSDVYAENTKRDFKIISRLFFAWLKPDKKELWGWIPTTQKDRRLIRTEDVLTEEEIYKMVDVAQHTRDRALISCLFESACRISELSNLKVGDIVFDEFGYHFICNGKTGEVYKRIANRTAVDLMKKWIEQHPFKANTDFKEQPLWTTLSRSHIGVHQIDNNSIRKMLKEIGKLANINKKLNPHWFRHSKITDMRVYKKIPDAVVEKIVGWKEGTNMFEVYSHTKSEDIDKTLQKIYGVDEEKQYAKALKKIEVKKPELWKALVEFMRKELKENKN